ncbi:hypothetical protein A1O3_00864 [Capronia epimyces CBS 606.96]|uniref:Uncharacterized protein n=1 Tax=Capronia epimyces CBS 606.96 TaxID=1182542 RepID=W9ZCR1_9EURO|nr:uncharacterized protein A1O3_00864 [Capronia epimyces CBS 606.96]EXJ92314.1 hypothetical protein A1O3_00864 [Capronia epimyces CBS 606.96]
MNASNDGSESVDQFLARIASLNSKQGLEEAERSRKMEEEMLQARRERQARRAERARSLSPSKTGPTPSLRPGKDIPKHTQGIEPPVTLASPLKSQTLGRSGSISPKLSRPTVSDLDFSRPLPPSPLNDEPSVPGPPPNATALSRSGTLSWNQRPSPRGVGSIRPRPQSVASIPDFNATLDTSKQKGAEEISRKDIAESLGAKDPSWFRQTSDRGAGSAAYRRGESEAEMSGFTARSMRLPGLSRDPAPADEHERVETGRTTPSASSTKHTLSSTSDQPPAPNLESSGRPRPVSLVSETPSKSVALELPTFKPLDLSLSLEPDAIGLWRTSSVLSSAGRPPSPTKGLGGFVQSAMMKRSDSVNKRWSVQASAGLKRGDSVAAASRPAHLSGPSEYSPGHSRSSSKDTRGVRDGYSSPLSGSRPVSSHGAEPVPFAKGRPFPQLQDESAPSPKIQTEVEQRGRSETLESVERQRTMRKTTPPPPESPLGRSPSKTMDPRRWSPTKASWLESALNKPDSPKFTPAKVETPAWRLSMQRSKLDEQSRSSDPAGVASPKPALALKPVSSPPLSSSETKDGKPFETDLAKPAPGKASPQKTALKPDLPLADIPVHPTKEATLKKEEKPVVPSKRNITPVQLKSSSNGQTEPEDLVSTGQIKTTEANARSQKTADDGPKSETKPPVVKSKPQTPPKTDFRANLRPRQAPSAAGNDTEPEFKAVFGKLKRTQTQHYVAPDLLKDNITKGKAALNTTGGPQKTKHVDELKESILQKKEAMKASGSTTSKRPDSTDNQTESARPVPEALARRMTLHKTGPSRDKVQLTASSDDTGKSGPPARGSQVRLEKPVLPKKDSSLPLQRPAVDAEKPQPTGLNKSEVIPAVVSPSKLASTSHKVEVRPTTALSPREPVSDPITAASSKVTVPENSKIAARLNPALAGLLTRTGSPRLPGDSSSMERGQGIVRETQQTHHQDVGGESAELTHMTKARAKGPKRRAPKSSTSKEPSKKEVAAPGLATSEVASKPPSAAPQPSLETRPAAPNNLPLRPLRGAATWAGSDAKTDGKTEKKPAVITRESSPAVPTSKSQAPQVTPTGRYDAGSVKISDPAHELDSSTRAKPPVANKSAELRKVSNTAGAPKPSEKASPAKSSTPKRFDVLTDRPTLVSSPPESDGERKVGSMGPSVPSALPLTPSKSKLNTPKPSKPLPHPSAKSNPATPSSKISGLGLKFESASKNPATMPELTPPPEPDVVSPSRMAVSSSVNPSPTKPNFALIRQLEGFFGVLPQAREKADFDTHGFLSSQHNGAEKTKTLSNQIWEVTGDGKRIAMPPQQEHILFEDCMYLCVHSMQSSNGSKVVEVYLWCGDEVPAAAIEDAQLFCRKVARDNSSRLQVVRQGKESSEFFQALGGIVIIRRNKSSALYMLCGRRHLGHVAFDEVDLIPTSLCSGLPFLISARFGKLYLWKGAGSDPEDVGCARLIGMDLGLTGEIEEISEGEEPPSFWESFPSGTVRRAAGQGHKTAGQFRGRPSKLYRVEHDRPKSSGGFWGLRASSPPKQSPKALVEEIVPFTQNDLDANHIHILDSYGEVDVLVGASAKKPAEFVTAVQIAQEMAVLSPSVQDRPALPSCFVVLGDPPPHVKAVFRKWTPQRTSPSPGAGASYVRVQEVMQELGMTL